MFVRCTNYGTGLQCGYLKELQNCYHCSGKFSTLVFYSFWQKYDVFKRFGTALKVGEDGDTTQHIRMLNEHVVALYESVCLLNIGCFMGYHEVFLKNSSHKKQIH
jgi:hypothetical protein